MVDYSSMHDILAVYLDHVISTWLTSSCTSYIGNVTCHSTETDSIAHMLVFRFHLRSPALLCDLGSERLASRQLWLPQRRRQPRRVRTSRRCYPLRRTTSVNSKADGMIEVTGEFDKQILL